MDIGPSELIIILLIVIVLFGSGRIMKLGGELGGAIRSFRDGLQEQEEQPTAKTDASAAMPPDEVQGASQTPASTKP